MTRTQILLGIEQYRWLITQARRRRTSLSQIMRGLIDSQRQRGHRLRKDDPLFRIIGTVQDRAHDVAEHHDRYLYGARGPKR